MSMTDQADVITTLRTRIQRNLGVLKRSERVTRISLIDPLLQSVGWDVTDPTQVAQEYTLPDGTRADYVMLDPTTRTPLMIVEAKRLGTNLQLHIDQMRRYAIALNCQRAVLTDGDNWMIFEDGTYNVRGRQTFCITKNALSQCTSNVHRIASPEQRKAIEYRLAAERWLSDEKRMRQSAEHQLSREQKTRRKAKRKLAKERKNREDAERWLANERTRRKQASQPRTNQRIDTAIKITITAGGYLLALVIIALLFVL